MLWPLLKKRLNDSKAKESTIAITDYLFRTFLVLITCMLTKEYTRLKLKLFCISVALTTVVPHLEIIIGLVGAVVLRYNKFHDLYNFYRQKFLLWGPRK
jgi:hypothetical protein